MLGVFLCEEAEGFVPWNFRTWSIAGPRRLRSHWTRKWPSYVRGCVGVEARCTNLYHQVDIERPTAWESPLGSERGGVGSGSPSSTALVAGGLPELWALGHLGSGLWLALWPLTSCLWPPAWHSLLCLVPQNSRGRCRGCFAVQYVKAVKVLAIKASPSAINERCGARAGGGAV
jgi:hypothetical protein